MAKRRFTELDKARHQIVELQDMIRNGTAALTDAHRDRNDALQERSKSEDKIKATMAHLHLARQNARRLLEQLLSANLRIARREGYIDRIRETDSGPTGAVVEDVTIEEGRNSLLNATTDRQVDRALAGLDDDTVADMLGRVDEPQG